MFHYPNNNTETKKRKFRSRTMECRNETAKIWWNEALNMHYKKNTHHIQYFRIHHLDETHLPEIVQREMVVDMLSCCMIAKHKAGTSEQWTVPELAFQCREWPNWKHAASAYTGTYEEPPKDRPNPQRWLFTHDERQDFDPELDALFELTNYFYPIRERAVVEAHDETTHEKINQLHELKCVKAYLKDLNIHKYYVEKYAVELYPNDCNLHEICRKHDLDKLLPFMIGAYTLRFVFNLGG